MKNDIQKLISVIVVFYLLTAFLAGCSSTENTEVAQTTETSLQMSEEIVLGTVPPTEENIPKGTFSTEDRIVEYFSKDELVMIPCIEEPASDFAEAFTQIQFEGYDTCLPLSDGISYDITEGESINLEIVRCLWTPEDNVVYIGLYDPETETGYAYAFVGGNTQVSVPFQDLPVGEYVVYIKNMGDRTITDGTLRYRIT